jgi:hypothetical protein
MDKERNIQVYQEKQNDLNRHLQNMEVIIKHNCNKYFEGNSMYEHCSFNRHPSLFNKQVNLFWVGTQGHLKMCEIGFNGGHSSLLMLLGRGDANIDYLVFDIVEHDYVKPCFEYVKTQFPSIRFEMIEGDSIQNMPDWISNHKDQIETFDVVHVDGGHSDECIKNDMINANKLVKKGGIVIIDDTDAPQINKYVDFYLQMGGFEEIDILPTPMYSHRMIRKL